MELFAIVVMNADESYVSKLSSQIENELRLLHMLQVKYTLHGKYAYIYGEADLKKEDAASLQNKLTEGLAGVLADHIITVKEPSILRELMSKEFKFEAKEDMDLVAGYCSQLLDGKSDFAESARSTLGVGTARRKQILVQLLIQYLEERHEFVLEGFLRFRLQEYLGELREIIEYAVDEFMMDRQYQEFISLLQYFVYIQEAKIPAAHLIHKGGHEFAILNERFEPIDTNEVDATFKLEVLEKDINFEDMIVSTLISVSPATIYIHTREPEVPIIKTIMQIFEDRTSVCSYCRLCHSRLGDRQQDQLYP